MKTFSFVTMAQFATQPSATVPSSPAPKEPIGPVPGADIDAEVAASLLKRPVKPKS